MYFVKPFERGSLRASGGGVGETGGGGREAESWEVDKCFLERA